MKLPFASMFREWRELARFQSLEPSARSIVFYAEDGGSWGHFAEIIESLTGTFGRQICYITSSPEDPVLERSDVRILPFYIGSGSARTQMFRTLNAQVMVMTMPDIETFHIKRSRHPVHYAYVHHSMISTHMAYRPDAFDHFDSVLCVGPYHEEEIRSRESMFGLKAKTLVAHGYGRLDAILRDRAGIGSPQPDVAAGKRRVLIAPSWGEYALLESCGVSLIEVLSEADYHVTVRPHPVTLKSNSKLIGELNRRFGADPNVEFEFDVASKETLHASDILVSDWSGVALEFAFGLERPVLFVDVPPKSNNPDWREIQIEPFEVSVRSRVGAIVSPDNLNSVPGLIESLCADPDGFAAQARHLRETQIYNVSTSGAVGAEYIAGLVGDRSG